VTDRPFNGYYQTLDYAIWKNGELDPLREMQTKAQIAWPKHGDTVAAGSNVRVHGAAWTGKGEIKRVELTVDGGSTWKEAKLTGEPQHSAWRLWEFDWKTPSKPGAETLTARATDSNGNTQPADRDPNRGTYMINHLLPIEVQVQ
jgi:DMSO/TMAO reductase YedYZ molybdopterin-dependent catalytic subunit